MKLTYLVAPDRLTTAAFVIRSYESGDGPGLNEATVNSYEHLRTFLPWASPDVSLDDSEKTCRQFRGRYLLAKDFTLGIFSPDESRLLGGTGFHLRDYDLADRTAEIGMWIRSDQAHRGLGTAVLLALLEWGFTDWPWLKLIWRCDSTNAASAAVARKAGLPQEALFKSDTFGADGQTRRDTLVFGLTRADWQAQRKPG